VPHQNTPLAKQVAGSKPCQLDCFIAGVALDDSNAAPHDHKRRKGRLLGGNQRSLRIVRRFMPPANAASGVERLL